MNEQQRQLLTNAAKAAGLKLDHYYNDKLVEALRGLVVHRGQLPGDATLWNPYEDDAQCLQLARHLGITIDYEDKCAFKRMKRGEPVFDEYFDQPFEGHWKTDREAVVAVAALMGEKL